MKYSKCLILFSLTLLMLSFTPARKPQKPYLPPTDHFGHIKSIHLVIYHAMRDSSGAVVNGNIISDKNTDDRFRMGSNKGVPMHGSVVPIETWFYDEYGDQVEDDKYHTNGSLYNKVIHQYDEDGYVLRVIDSSREFGNKWNLNTQEYKYVFNPAGDLLRKYEFDYYPNRTSPDCKKEIYLYDSSGKNTEEVYFTRDTVNPSRVMWNRYNEKGQSVQTDESDELAGGRGNYLYLEPATRHVMWYDEQGRMIDRATYKYHSGLTIDVKTGYNKNGSKVETFFYHEPGRMLTQAMIKQVFDSTHTVQEDTYNSDGQLTNYTITHLDNDNNPVDKGTFLINYRQVLGDDRRYHSEAPGDTIMTGQVINNDHFYRIEDDTYSSSDGKLTKQVTNQYKYDNVGNWIQKIVFNNNKPVRVEEREIEYFKD